MKEAEIKKRSFERDGCHIVQKPCETELIEYSSDCEVVRGTLSLVAGLFYLGVVDFGEDYFKVSLTVKRPTRWNGGISETVTIVRQFLDLSEVKEWVLGLEQVILDAIFSKDNVDDKATEVRQDRTVIRMLLGLTKSFSKLNSTLREDAEKRKNLLD